MKHQLFTADVKHQRNSEFTEQCQEDAILVSQTNSAKDFFFYEKTIFCSPKNWVKIAAGHVIE